MTSQNFFLMIIYAWSLIICESFKQICLKLTEKYNTQDCIMLHYKGHKTYEKGTLKIASLMIIYKWSFTICKSFKQIRLKLTEKFNTQNCIKL